MSDSAPNPTPVLGSPRKPLDNPHPHKPFPPQDHELGAELRGLLPDLAPKPGQRLLDALAEQSRDTARRLLLVSARIHGCADERRVAEYLLRHLDEVRTGRRPAAALVSAARCAAEMDERRTRSREVPVAGDVLSRRPADGHMPALDVPSPADAVVSCAAAVIPVRGLSASGWDRLRDAVVIAFEVAERHGTHDRSRPALVAMRSDARVDARLSTRLRAEYGDHAAARSMARLLVGSVDAPVSTALLWWAVRPRTERAAIPAHVRRRWARDLAAVDPARRRPARSRLKAAEGS
jgi:hypothetical protein